jgi:zinc transporter, ZIP family
VPDVESIIIYSLFSGSTIFLGGLLSYYFGDHVDAGKIKSEVIHTATAFGGAY